MLTIYKASAGSGKTYRLTLHYITNLLGVKTVGADSHDHWQLNPAYARGGHPNAHRHILAITFTNKATEQMKDRIIEGLDLIARGEHRNYIDTLTDRFGCPEADLRHAASLALSSLLLDYKFFNVSTIDSFFQSILRAFAYELDMQGDYEVELGEDDTIRDALDSILDRVNTGRGTRRGGDDARMTAKVRKWVEQLVARRISADSTKAYNPFQRGHSVYSDLVAKVKEIFKEDFKSRERDMNDYLVARDGALECFTDALNRRLEAIETEAPDIPRRLGDLMSRHGLGLDDLNGRLYRSQIQGLADNPPRWPNLSDSIVRIASGEASASIVSQATLKRHPSLADDASTISDIFARLVNLKRQKALIALVLDDLIYLEFTGFMLKTMHDINDDRNRIVLGDTNKLISQIISGSDAPFIYERIGVFLDNFLIDEFQDTSRMQWRNLLPLVRNGLSEGHDSLIIGDTKQAIYRFRNSDSSMLGSSLYNRDFAGDPDVEVLGTAPVDNTNWRTSQTIVRFNNTLFPVFAAKVGQPAGFAGNEVMQMSDTSMSAENMPGMVRMYPYTKSADNRGMDDIDAMEQRLVDAIIDQKNRGYRNNEIAVLVRRHDDPAGIIARLVKAHIPVQSRDSLYVSSARSVRMIVSLLESLSRIGTTTRRDADTPSTRRGPSYEDSLYIMSRVDYATALNPDLKWQDAFDEAIASFNSADDPVAATLSAVAANHPSSLVAVVESIIEAGLIPDTLLDAEKDYVAAFVDFVTDYSEQHDDDIRSFLRRWSEKKSQLSVPPPPDTDAVHIMTVHQAKGLEWPCVHIPLFEWPPTPRFTEVKWVTAKPAADPATGGVMAPDFDVVNTLGLDIDPDDVPPLIKLRIKNDLKGLDPGVDALVDDIRSLQAVDMLNLVYVAFTRPRQELFVYYNNDAPGTNARATDLNAGQQLVASLDEIAARPDAPVTVPPGLEMALTPECYDSATGIVTIGQPTHPVRRKADAVAADDACATLTAADVSGGYVSTYRPDTQVIVRVDALDNGNDLDDDTNLDPKDDLVVVPDRVERAAERGLSLHRLMERIISRDDLAGVLADIDDEPMRDRVRDLLAPAVSLPEAARWFADSPAVSEVRTELSVFVPNKLDNVDFGDVSRIDRAVFYNDGSIDIVDYKFTTGRSRDNREQVARYVRAMRDLFPGHTVRGFLWYIDRGEISPVKV